MEVRAGDSFLKSLRRLYLKENPLYIYFWKNLYSECKWIIWALKKYFKISTTMRPWDYKYILDMMKFQLITLRDFMRDKGIEVDETRLPKIEKMNKVIELIENQINDDFYDRCGYIYTDFEFEEIEEKENEMKLYKIKENEGEIKEKNDKASKEACELEEKEWDELFDLLKDMRRWWD